MSYKTIKKIRIAIIIVITLLLGLIAFSVPSKSFAAPASNSSSYRTLLPFADSTYNLGSELLKWGTIYGDLFRPDAIQFSTTTTPLTSAPGLLQWNDTDETLDLGMPDGITLQIGQETQLKVRNNTGSPLLNGRPVYTTGMLGNRPTVAYAQGDAPATSHVLGLLTQDISNNADGKVTTFGYVRNIDTTGAPYGETWADGDDLWVSTTTAGYLTNVEPPAPHHSDYVGEVVNAHATQGSILVRIVRHKTLDSLSDVDGAAPTLTGDLLTFDSGTSVWERGTYNITDYLTVSSADSTYWKNDGSSTATGNWSILGYSLTASQLDLVSGANTLSMYTTSFGQTYYDVYGAIAPEHIFSINGTPVVTVGGSSVTFDTNVNFGSNILEGSNWSIETGGFYTSVLQGYDTNGIMFKNALGNTVVTFGDSSGTASVFSGIISAPLGAVGTPSYTFTGDLNTGMWSPTADTLAWSTGGSERARLTSTGLGIGTTASTRLHVVSTTEQSRIGYDASNYFSTTVGSAGNVAFDITGATRAFVFNESGADVDFRVEGDTVTSLIQADAGLDNVGIGANAQASSRLFVSSSISTNQTHYAQRVSKTYSISSNDTSQLNWAADYQLTKVGAGNAFDLRGLSGTVIINGSTTFGYGLTGGITLSAGTSAAGTVLYGMTGAIAINDGTVGTATGLLAQNSATTGNITTAIGAQVRSINMTGAGSVGTAYGLNVVAPGNSGGGTITNSYGIYMQDFSTVGTNKYAIYSLGGAIVFNENGTDSDIRFEGDTDQFLFFTDASTDRVGIGASSAPASKLHIISTSEQFRSGYNTTNYWNATTDSTGLTTFDAVSSGSGAEFLFSDRIRYTGTYAEIYVADNASAQSIPTGATYTKVTAFATNGQSSNATADQANDKITLTKAGKYLVNGMIDVQAATANTRLDLAVFAGGTIQNNIKSYVEFPNANVDQEIVVSGIISVSANTDIDLRVKHDDAGSVNITVENANLTITYLGE